MKTNKKITSEFYQAMLKNQGWEDFLAEEATYLGPLASLIEGKAVSKFATFLMHL